MSRPDIDENDKLVNAHANKTNKNGQILRTIKMGADLV